jgi:hypothetical protein
MAEERKMKKTMMGLVVVAAFALAACDEPAGDQRTEEQSPSTAIEEQVVEETTTSEEAAAESEASDPAAAMNEMEEGCRAAAEALAVWTEKPWEEAKEAVSAGEGVATVRVIRPGEPVTMDYRANRLNVELDDGDKIVRIFCG